MAKKTDIPIKDLVSMIQNGELRLPEMQRRYVWTSTRVRDLLDSLYRGYPSGSILVWETDLEQPVRDLAVSQSAPAFSTYKLLLDGQQRLTSLSAVIRGEPVMVKNRQRPIDIAFNLDHPEGSPVEILEVEDDEESPIRATDETQEEDTETSERESTIMERLNKRTFAVAFRNLLAQPNWVSVTEVFKGKTDWELVKKLVNSPDDPEFKKYSERLQKLRNVCNYQYVMHVLGRDLSYEEVAEIFVRVNSLGAKLRGSDLALAQVTAKWRNSLKLFEEFAEECEEQQFTIDVGLLVRLMVVFATKQCQFKTVSSIPLEKMKESWEKAKEGMRYAINFLRANADIEDESLLSSPFFIIPIATYGILKDGQISPADEASMLRWLYVASAKAHYSGSSESKLDYDIGLLFKGNSFEALIEPLHQRYGRLHVEAGDFAGRDPRNALFSLAYLALKHSGAKDWRTGLGLSLTHQGKLHYIEYHHIFPKSLLQKAGYEKAEINEIANMAFISGRANRGISNKEPKEYFPSIVKERSESALSSQYIPLDTAMWKITAYRDFLGYRREALAKAVNEFIESACKAGRATALGAKAA